MLGVLLLLPLLCAPAALARDFPAEEPLDALPPPPEPAAAPEPTPLPVAPPTAGDPRALADRLLAAGMARQAYAELVGAALDARDPAVAADWERQAGALLWQAGRHGDAAAHFVAWSLDEPDARLGLAWSLAQQRAWLPAQAVFDQLEGPDARFLSGWVAVRAEQPALALEHWRAVPADDALYPAAQGLLTEVGAWGRVPYRSPALAGTLSAVLPGAGQAYVGRWGEAASALVVNGLLIASAVELGRRELWFGMGLALFFEAGFYGGNVLSATHGARRYNRRAWDALLEPVESKWAPTVSPGPTGWQVTPAGQR